MNDGCVIPAQFAPDLRHAELPGAMGAAHDFLTCMCDGQGAVRPNDVSDRKPGFAGNPVGNAANRQLFGRAIPV